MGARQRAGFTLVELLVVIAIIGMLVALSLPAISIVRETARRNNCQQNMRELARAIKAYELSKDRYPPSFMDSPGAAGVGIWPWVPTVLPYMDREELYNNLLANASDIIEPDKSDSSISATEFNRTQKYIIAQLMCPSDSSTRKDEPYLSYVVNMGIDDNFATTSGTPLASYDVKENGIFVDRFTNPSAPDPPGAYPRKYPESIQESVDESDVKDGAQYTLLLTENLNATIWTLYFPTPVAPSDSITPNYYRTTNVYGYNYSPSAGVYENILEYRYGVLWSVNNTGVVGVNRDTELAAIGTGDVEEPFRPARDPAHARPSSQHPGGFNVAFVGGNVRFIDEEIDYITYRQIMAIQDSQAAYFDTGATPPVWKTKDSDAASMTWYNTYMTTAGNPFDPNQLDP